MMANIWPRRTSGREKACSIQPGKNSKRRSVILDTLPSLHITDFAKIVKLFWPLISTIAPMPQ